MQYLFFFELFSIAFSAIDLRILVELFEIVELMEFRGVGLVLFCRDRCSTSGSSIEPFCSFSANFLEIKLRFLCNALIT